MQQAGYARFAYNWGVAEFKAGLDVGEWLSERTLRPRWNKVKGMIAPWGSELSQNAAKYAIIDFGAAAENWGEYRHRVRAGQRPGRRGWFPPFQAAQARAGFSRRQRARHRAGGGEGGHSAEDRQRGDG